MRELDTAEINTVTGGNKVRWPCPPRAIKIKIMIRNKAGSTAPMMA